MNLQVAGIGMTSARNARPLDRALAQPGHTRRRRVGGDEQCAAPLVRDEALADVPTTMYRCPSITVKPFRSLTSWRA